MPPSLKGITSTNEDPNLCAICSAPFPKGCYTRTSVTFRCCGKRICNDCNTVEIIFETTRSGSDLCSLCKRPASDGDAIGVLKKHAKKGRPWAQFHLGSCFGNGKYVTKSYFDAVRWYRKAAARGHPEAYLRLARKYLDGDGCTTSLSDARKYAEKAMLLDANLFNDARELVSWVGAEYVVMRTDKSLEEAKLILTPLAEANVGNAKHYLGLSFFHEDNYTAAEKWFASAAIEENQFATSAFFAMQCCDFIGKIAQARCWTEAVTKRKEELTVKDEQRLEKDITVIWAGFRKLRDTCGGCGAVLDGKMRKICSQCKTYCYCNRECQKVHWNRQGKGGHREDCMGVIDLKEKMKKMRIEKNTSAD